MLVSSPSLNTQVETEAQDNCEWPEAAQQVRAEPVLDLGLQHLLILKHGCTHSQFTPQGEGTHQAKPGPGGEAPVGLPAGASSPSAPLSTTFPCQVLSTHPLPLLPLIQPPKRALGSNVCLSNPLNLISVPTLALVWFCLQLPAPVALLEGCPRAP